MPIISISFLLYWFIGIQPKRPPQTAVPNIQSGISIQYPSKWQILQQGMVQGYGSTQDRSLRSSPQGGPPERSTPIVLDFLQQHFAITYQHQVSNP